LAAVRGSRAGAEQLQDRRYGNQVSHGDEIDWPANWCGSGAGIDASLCLPLFMTRLPLTTASRAGFGDFPVAGFVHHLIAAERFVAGRHIADRAAQPLVVVVSNETCNQPRGIYQRQRHQGTDAIASKGLVPAFDLSVALRIVRGYADVRHASKAAELLEVLGDELWTIVDDDPWRHAWVGLTDPLQDDLHLSFLHLFADFPVHDEPTATIEHGEQEEERARNVEVTHVDMPVFVRRQWPVEPN
jgi:hypothetical protein